MWTVKRCVVADEIPDGRTTVYFRFARCPQSKRSWWLVLERSAVDLGDATLAAALRRRTISLEGPEHLVRAFARGSGLSPFIGLERGR
jgi:hypothetical protein